MPLMPQLAAKEKKIMPIGTTPAERGTMAGQCCLA
jgi:hypothetical protein